MSQSIRIRIRGLLIKAIAKPLWTAPSWMTSWRPSNPSSATSRYSGPLGNVRQTWPTPRGGIYDKLKLSSVKDYIDSTGAADPGLRAAYRADSERLEEGLEDVHRAVSRYRRLATLGTLVDVILHEGRNPLAAISGAVDLVKDQLSTNLSPTRVKELNRRLETISHQAQLLLHLFERISPFSGKARARREPAEPRRSHSRRLRGTVGARREGWSSSFTSQDPHEISNGRGRHGVTLPQPFRQLAILAPEG